MRFVTYLAACLVSFVPYVYGDPPQTQSETPTLREQREQRDDDLLVEPPARVFRDRQLVELSQLCERDDFKAVERLAASTRNLNSKGAGGVTVLHRALFARSRRSFAILLANGASPNVVDDRGLSVVHYAAYGGDAYWLTLALRHGGDPNSNAENHHTPLLSIAAAGEFDEDRRVMAMLLIAAGAELNVCDEKGTPLCLVALNPRSFRLAQLLVEMGADFQKKRADGIDLPMLVERMRTDKIFSLDAQEKVDIAELDRCLKSRMAR